MTPDTRIQIIEWLMQRESLLARVHGLEQEIHTIFGEPYPLEAPDLPSRRRKKSRAAAPGKSSAESRKPPAIRRLQGDENAYRIEYLFQDTPRVEFHTDAQLLKTFLAARLPRVEVLSLSAGILTGEDWQETEVLHVLSDTE